MTTLLEKIEYELKLAGYRLEPIKEGNWSEDDYVQQIGNCAYEMCKLFSEQGHSEMSAEFTIELLYKLLKGDILTPLTNDKKEWLQICDEPNNMMYQSKRKFSCFSKDLKTYYDIDDKNREEKELVVYNAKTN